MQIIRGHLRLILISDILSSIAICMRENDDFLFLFQCSCTESDVNLFFIGYRVPEIQNAKLLASRCENFICFSSSIKSILTSTAYIILLRSNTVPKYLIFVASQLLFIVWSVNKSDSVPVRNRILLIIYPYRRCLTT